MDEIGFARHGTDWQSRLYIASHGQDGIGYIGLGRQDVE